MRKMIIALLMIAVLTIPVYSIAFEVGISASGVPGSSGDVDGLVGFHLGVSPWAILYASWDAVVAPPSLISDFTSTVNDEGEWVLGQYLPGFINLFDVGVRFVLGPVVLVAEVGTNMIHVYDPESALGITAAGGAGANLRLGAGLKFGWWGVGLFATKIFTSFEEMADTFSALAAESTRKWAGDRLLTGLIPSLTASIYF